MTLPQSIIHQGLLTLSQMGSKGFQQLPTKVKNTIFKPINVMIFSPMLSSLDYEPFKNKIIAIKLRTLNIPFHVIAKNGCIEFIECNTSDVQITSDIPTLLCLLLKLNDVDTYFFQRRIEITGNTAIGLEIKHCMDGFDIPLFPKSVERLLRNILSAYENERENDNRFSKAPNLTRSN